MIRQHAAAFRLALAAADAALVLLVILGAAGLRFGRQDAVHAFGQALPNPPAALAGFVLTWLALLWLNGLYWGRGAWTPRGDAAAIGRSTAGLVAVTLSTLFLFKLPDVSRLYLLIVFPTLAIATMALRIATRSLLSYLRRRGTSVRYVLVVGANARAGAFADLMESHAEFGLVVVGHLKAGPQDDGAQLKRPLLGTADDLETVLHGRIVDEVAICLPFAMEELIENAARLCEREGKVVRIPAAPVERVLVRGRLETVDGLAIYSITSGPDKALGLMVKRVLDLVGSALLLALLWPLFVVLAVAIKLDSRGGAFYRQQRVGLHGRSFAMVKFRSMCDRADDQLEGLLDRNAIKGQAFKVEDDPRITRVGRFIRHTSLDELPQLWNVLRGQMSLVGPRPPLPREVESYDVWHRRRLSMKPGMTGLWQVGGRSSSEFDQWVEKDLQYIDEWSLLLDLKILARTVPAMLSGR
jgi:exopolysaccharide biosynthesis polyprenyl glycosylphosphotransferase